MASSLEEESLQLIQAFELVVFAPRIQTANTQTASALQTLTKKMMMTLTSRVDLTRLQKHRHQPRKRHMPTMLMEVKLACYDQNSTSLSYHCTNATKAVPAL
jgi:hypothetical protein